MNAPAAVLALLLLTALPAQAQDWAWAQRAGASSFDYGLGVATDAAGNGYVTGRFSGITTFGPFTLASTGQGDVFVVKYAPDGTVLWARSGGGPFFDDGDGVTVSATGDVFVTGSFGSGITGGGSATFGDFTLTSAGIGDVFVVKYSPEGEVLWARSGGGPSSDTGAEVALDADGNAYVTGRFSGTAAFGPLTLATTGGWDVFVVKYGPDGEERWAERGGGGDDSGSDIAVDAVGNAYVTGRYSGTATFGPFTLPPPTSYFYGVFVVKYAPDGTVLWAQSNGGGTSAEGSGIAVDTAGNAYITGRFGTGSPGGTVTFGSLTLQGLARNDVFVVKYAPDGEALWARSGAGAGNESGAGVAVDADGNAYVTGTVGGRSGDIGFDSYTLHVPCGPGTFVAKYTPSGDVLWARVSGGSDEEESWGVAVDAVGNAYVTGHFEHTAAFGRHALFSAGERDVFVARYDASATPPIVVASEPVGGPVVIGPGGGSFDFTVALTNTTAQPQTFEVWTAVTKMGRLFSRARVLGPTTVTLAPGASVSPTVTQAVPAGSPSGAYAYHVLVGGFRCIVAASATFPFEKAPGALAAAPLTDDADGWAATGWDEVAEPGAAAAALPDGFALSAPHPNPSDSATRLTLDLAEAQRVTAAVYDGLGRRVAVLLDDAVEAGAHVLVLDGASLPAGVYLVRVTGEAFAASRRLTLVR